MADEAKVIEALKTKWKRLDGAPEIIHRLRRSLSWLERAGAENNTGYEMRPVVGRLQRLLRN